MEITIYTQENCIFCTQIKAFFQQKNISYQEKDISKESEHLCEFLALGGNGVPLTIIGDKKYTGFNEALKNAVTNHSY